MSFPSGSQQMQQQHQQPVKRHTRNARACRRCRQLRTKCRNDGGQPPCESCQATNSACIFLSRGEPDRDRQVRRPRTSTTAARSRHNDPAANSPLSPSPRSFPSPAPLPPVQAKPFSVTVETSYWDLLPPSNELVEGIHTFTTSFFQLGFVPKSLFFERLRKDPNSISVFLLFSILSISARFTPSLVKRYGGASNATELFLGRAAALVPELMDTPTLQTTQALFLLSIVSWGKGDKHRSSIHMNLAITMAGILRLHREETYRLPDDATAEEFVHAEVARRTFWMLETYNNLLSGLSSPVSISYGDISALLPCGEDEFAFGGLRSPRAALAGTLPALNDPSLVHCASRSLFATLLQTHNLWGQVARLVSPDSEDHQQQGRIRREDFMKLSTALEEFEINIPPLHRWSTWNLRGFKAEGLDLAYFSAVMVLRLSHIVLRRRYLHVRLGSPLSSAGGTGLDSEYTITELFQNMLLLHEQIDAFFDFRSPAQGFPALIVFCVYVCGSLANHLHQEPHVCPSIAPRAEDILRKSLSGLGELQDAWPIARRWNTALCRASSGSRNQVVANPRSQSQSHTVSDPDSTHHVSDNGGLPVDSPSDVVRLNDPFPTDAMLMEFEAYSWNDIFTAIGTLDVDQSLGESG